jgi:superfamily II DNA or RNA helicase
MPISWKGTLAQYVGRLHREHHAKREVIVYDYVDSGVPMLARMALKRQAGYRTLGYQIGLGEPSPPGCPALTTTSK